MKTDSQPSRARTRLLPLAVLIAVGAGSLATFSVTRRVVDDQEKRLLTERTDAVRALLSVSIISTESSLQAVGRLGSSSTPESAQRFGEVASPLVKKSVAAVAVAAESGTGFAVLAGVGDSPAPGATLSRARAALAARALTEGKLVTDLVTDDRGTRVILAVPTTSSQRAVAFQESVIDRTPVAPTPSSPFRELRVALYASKTNDPSRLLITTERQLPLTGGVERVPFPVGADTWLLAVSARYPLVGSFAQRVPWLLLGIGLITALLASAMAETLVRRRRYALGLVSARTRELGETRAFLERMLTAGPVLVERITLPDRRISYVSPNVERVIGVGEEEALAPDFLGSQVHPEDAPGFHAALNRVVEGASRREIHEHRVAHSGDQYRWVSTTLVPDTDHGGDAVAALGYVVDIDDRRRAEQAQRDAQLAAEAANHSKSEFLSRMSHELRTPLNAVLGFGQLLELEELSDDQRDAVDQILKGGRHLLALINEVLDISRIEAGELGLSPEAVLVSELVRETVDLIRPLADQRGIQIVADRSGFCDYYVFSDRQRVKQVLLNLLSNAVKYNRSRGTVAVSCAHPSPTQVRIDVADTGPGIPTERLGELFTPFERLGAQDTDIEGTGIGLALSQRLAEAMGGTLTVSSTLGEGSTFSVALPRVEGPVQRYERLGGEPEHTAVAVPQPNKVLHIEDNLANLKLVERIFARRPDIELVAAMHGRLGLELAHEHRPILVLLDLHLPDMGGEQVLQRLRDDPVTASIPVVIVSADATPGQVQRLLAAGATAYLSKPFDVRELLGVLDGALVS